MLESGPPSRSSVAPRRRLARLGALSGAGAARGVAAAAAVALLAAEVLPWATLTMRAASQGDVVTFNTDTLYISAPSLHAVDLPPGVAVPFQLGWALALAALAVALLGPLRLRRPLSAAAVGLAVGQVALVAGVIGGSSDTAGMFSLFGAGPASGATSEFQGHQGPGMFCAGLAALLALVAAGLVLRDRTGVGSSVDEEVQVGHRAAPAADPPGAWRRDPDADSAAGSGRFGPDPVGLPGNGHAGERRDPWAEDDLGPIDLTVTALPPSGYRRPGP